MGVCRQGSMSGCKLTLCLQLLEVLKSYTGPHFAFDSSLKENRLPQ